MEKSQLSNKGRKASYEEVRWDEVQSQVKKINPTLANIIDEFEPSPKHTFIKVQYPYGTNIRDKGELRFPNKNGELVPLNDPTIPPAIYKKLSYGASQLAIIFSKTVEIFVETADRTLPFKFYGPGNIFGTWEIMDSPLISLPHHWGWSISAGARTLFMLPKITDSAGHLKLRQEYNVQSPVPRDLFDHGTIFSEIFNNAAPEIEWYTEILFFTGEWLTPQLKNTGWLKLRDYWTRTAWQQVLYWANKMIIDYNWEAYIAKLIVQKIKLKPYLLDTIKHLISIGCGTIPGFKPADDSEYAAPTKLLQDAYIDVYGLKQYIPIILHPDFLDIERASQPIYYSLGLPTLPENPSKFEVFSSVFKILRELHELLMIYLDVSKDYVTTGKFSRYCFSTVVKFDFFHTEIDPYKIIQPICNIVKNDSLFTSSPEKYKTKAFPENAPFFRGCIALSLDISEKNNVGMS